MGYIKPDSALVRAATDLLSRHAGQAGGTCPSCGESSPCASARHAVEVRRAADLPETISAVDPLVSDGSDALSAPIPPVSFGSGFSGNSGYGDSPTPALAGAGQSGANAGSFGSRPVPLSKATAAAE